MNGYRVKYDDSTAQEIKGLARAVLDNIKKRIEWLADNAREIRHQALRGSRLENRYKLRVGDYRVIYTSHAEKLIVVKVIGHRSQLYKER